MVSALLNAPVERPPPPCGRKDKEDDDAYPDWRRCRHIAASTAAFAGQTEGLIKKVDKDALTLTLDDGKSYKLNAETDLDALKPGMDIVIAYDVTNGENVVTDMELPDSSAN